MATFNALTVVMKNDAPFLVQQAREEADKARLEMERARMSTEDHAGHMRRWDARADDAMNMIDHIRSVAIPDGMTLTNHPIMVRNIRPSLRGLGYLEELLQFGSRSEVQELYEGYPWNG